MARRGDVNEDRELEAALRERDAKVIAAALAEEVEALRPWVALHHGNASKIFAMLEERARMRQRAAAARAQRAPRERADTEAKLSKPTPVAARPRER